jgi:tRNA pseudouridine55 synthase
MTPEDYLEGQILLIDKPLKWSSFQAVNKLKFGLIKELKLPKKFKIGHAGTLDPLASGLLLICTGKFTKRIEELQGQAKEYTGTITVGGTTPSYDLETEINETFPTKHITEALIHETLPQFIGEIDQKPPVFSAIKKDGKRLYESARAGIEVEIIAYDFGLALNSGGHLTALRRTKIGDYSVENGVEPEAFIEGLKLE